MKLDVCGRTRMFRIREEEGLTDTHFNTNYLLTENYMSYFPTKTNDSRNVT